MKRRPYHLVLLSFLALAPLLTAQALEEPLAEALPNLAPIIEQGWGKLGLNTAAAPTDGRPASPLQIGEKIYSQGLGHHAEGSLTLRLPKGEYTAFEAEVGVQWQGGQRGSVLFEVQVDGEKRFESPVLSDSSPPVALRVSLENAATLKLLARNAGDGIGCDMANWAAARLLRDPNAIHISEARIRFENNPPLLRSPEINGFALIAAEGGPQVASLGADACLIALAGEEAVYQDLEVSNIKLPTTLCLEAALLAGGPVRLRLKAGALPPREILLEAGVQAIEYPLPADLDSTTITLHTQASAKESLLRLKHLELRTAERSFSAPLFPTPPDSEVCTPPILPTLRPALQEALVEWDWRLHDGIGTEREPQSYRTALDRLLEAGDHLITDLKNSRVGLDPQTAQWRALKQRRTALEAAPEEDPRWEALWREVHALKRAIAFRNPRFPAGPLLFAKRPPAAFSHQLTQYYGSHARAGGGLFILDQPGTSMAARCLVGPELPPGNFMQPEISYEGDRILFAYCEVPFAPTKENTEERIGRCFHLFEIRPDASGLRQMTDGPYNDFSPCFLPNGRILFLSTRRGGYHRCGRGPCPVYTLTLADADGSNIETVSYHETQEWDPAVLADGRVIYTRWDYVDRNAVHYQQLWTVRPDGSAPAAYYGNNTFNPVGVWEARQVPDSPYIMATAAAHHAMTAGAIILLDTTKAIDGPAPIRRLTPDAPFPESETYVAPRNWHAPGSPKNYETPEAARRWPGHCYRSPFPLSEKYFLAAYSYDPLIGEPDGNKVNMFGLYWVDAFGNRELLYRDPSISSLWPKPLRPRSKPPVIPKTRNLALGDEGVFFLQDVYASEPALPKGSIKALRILQVLPKTTPHANNPTVGKANASPGKQVLGTVPVEEDGSACFLAPARTPLAFQALDDQGRAIQVMRSVTYLQPGEQASCVGCHEHRLTAPPHGLLNRAMNRPPSTITPAPDGAHPLSYPLLVQPVLDKHCVRCHDGVEEAGKKKGPIVLTGAVDGRYTKSYNALIDKVAFSAWGGSLEENCEPLTRPDTFGARASALMQMLDKGHHEVELSAEDRDRLITWMDANALFYGTFDPEDQKRQQLGKRIAGPALE